MRKQSSWKRLSEKVIFNNRVKLIDYAVKLPDGKESNYVVDHADGSVAVIIKLPNNKYLLTYQYRFPLDKRIYDLPGGGIRQNESPESAAIRECYEEIGFIPQKLKLLAKFAPNPGRSDWYAHIFYTENIKKTGYKKISSSENVEFREFYKIEIDNLIKERLIVDPCLLIGWYYLHSL